MRCAGGTAPEISKHPDELAVVILAVAEVVEGVFGGEAELLPDAVGNEAIESGAFVDFIEMREGLAGVEFAAVAERPAGGRRY